ncbi:MAG: DinB family protein [Cloacibacterium sp.]
MQKSQNNTLFNALINVLSEHIFLLEKISDLEYTKPIFTLNSSTIGGHTRHMIEFLDLLLSSYNSGIVEYDARERNKTLENNTEFAVTKIKEILSKIDLPNKEMTLTHNSVDIITNFDRELLYNIEHCIHHQALVKVAVKELNIEHLVTDDFGVAASTVLYRKQNIS